MTYQQCVEQVAQKCVKLILAAKAKSHNIHPSSMKKHSYQEHP